MKRMGILLFALIFVSCLAGCDTAKNSQPLETGKYLEQLDAAFSATENAEDLLQTITLTHSRTVGGETFTTVSRETVSCQDLTSAAPLIYREEDVSYGSYRTQIRRCYRTGDAFLTIGEKTFSGEANAKSYLQSMIPAVLFQPENYAAVTAESAENGVMLTFRDAAKLESWVTEQDATLLSASATATLDTSGNLLECSYQATYTQGDVHFALDITSQTAIPEQLDLRSQLPDIPADRVILSDPELPVHILRAVGDLFTARRITSQYTEVIESDAIRTNRHQQTQLQLSGAENDLSADISYTISLSDYSGNSTSSVTTERYRNGRLTTATDGEKPVTTDTLSPQDMRTRCEDLLLLSMFAISYLDDADVQIQDGLCHISLAGDQQLNDRLCQNIYALLGADLDALSSDYSDEPATGYLTLDAHSGLPVAAGMTVERTHAINGAFQTLTYQLDQTYAFTNEAS